MLLNSYQPQIDVDPQTYQVKADGELLVCEPAKDLPWRRSIFCFEFGLLSAPESVESDLSRVKERCPAGLTRRDLIQSCNAWSPDHDKLIKNRHHR